MKQYNFLQAIVMSFYSPKLYRDVARNWGADVVLYLLLILAISWIIFMIPVQIGINQFYQHFSTVYVPQLPQITIKNGVAKTAEPRPFYIKESPKEEPVAMIDTTGQHTTLDQPGLKMLLTSKEFIYKDNAGNLKITKLSENWNYNFVPQTVSEKVAHWVAWFWLFLFPIVLFFALIYRLVQAVIYALLGKVFALIFQIPLHYSAILKLAMVSITPVIVIGTIFDFVVYAFPYEKLVYFILGIGYLFFAIHVNKTKE